MTEDLALAYAQSRQRQLGAVGYDMSYKHFTLHAGEVEPQAAAGQLWLLVAADPDILIKSDTGGYYPKSKTLQIHQHEHTGRIIVQNNGISDQQVKFVVFAWRYPTLAAPVSAAK